LPLIAQLARVQAAIERDVVRKDRISQRLMRKFVRLELRLRRALGI